MKEIYKNPIFYYIVIPIIVALWPLLVWAVYLPAAEDEFKEDRKQYTKAQQLIAAILAHDPTRLDIADSNDAASKFDYATSVDDIARRCNIPAANYTISSKPRRISRGQESQNATVVLKEVDISTFADFLSKIQLRWANLECESVTLTKKKGLRDAWKVDLNFKYYYY